MENPGEKSGYFYTAQVGTPSIFTQAATTAGQPNDYWSPFTTSNWAVHNSDPNEAQQNETLVCRKIVKVSWSKREFRPHKK